MLQGISVTFRIPLDSVASIDREALKTNRSRSGMIRQIVMDATKEEIRLFNKQFEAKQPVSAGPTKNVIELPQKAAASEWTLPSGLCVGCGHGEHLSCLADAVDCNCDCEEAVRKRNIRQA